MSPRVSDTTLQVPGWRWPGEAATDEVLSWWSHSSSPVTLECCISFKFFTSMNNIITLLIFSDEITVFKVLVDGVCAWFACICVVGLCIGLLYEFAIGFVSLLIWLFLLVRPKVESFIYPRNIFKPCLQSFKKYKTPQWLLDISEKSKVIYMLFLFVSGFDKHTRP